MDVLARLAGTARDNDDRHLDGVPTEMQYAADVAAVHVIRFVVDEDAPPITPER
jgi:hypothetical protein